MRLGYTHELVVDVESSTYPRHAVSRNTGGNLHERRAFRIRTRPIPTKRHQLAALNGSALVHQEKRIGQARAGVKAKHKMLLEDKYAGSGEEIGRPPSAVEHEKMRRQPAETCARRANVRAICRHRRISF